MLFNFYYDISIPMNRACSFYYHKIILYPNAMFMVWGGDVPMYVPKKKQKRIEEEEPHEEEEKEEESEDW